MPEQVTVIARVEAKAGKEQEVSSALQSLVRPTLKEQGCINYDLHQDLDDPRLFFFHENWESRELLNQHLASAHVQAFRVRADDLLSQPPEIRVLRKLIPPE
jgi:quinol monooxygenase YgiN